MKLGLGQIVAAEFRSGVDVGIEHQHAFPSIRGFAPRRRVCGRVVFEKTRESLAEAPVEDKRAKSAAETFEEGRIEDAQTALAQLIAAEPANADALNLMAQIAHAQLRQKITAGLDPPA